MNAITLIIHDLIAQSGRTRLQHPHKSPEKHDIPTIEVGFIGESIMIMIESFLAVLRPCLGLIEQEFLVCHHPTVENLGPRRLNY